MNTKRNETLTKNAQKLRKNMTREERQLWYGFLKPLPINVHRQKTIGPYIVDFYIASAKIVIEIDGSQHYEKESIIIDKKEMNTYRNTVLRFFAIQIMMLTVISMQFAEIYQSICSFYII